MVEKGESAGREVYSASNASYCGGSKASSINASISAVEGIKLTSFVNETTTSRSIVTGLKPISIIMPSKMSTSTPKAKENWSRKTASMCISATSAAMAYSNSFGSLDSVSMYVSRNGVAGIVLEGLVGTDPTVGGVGREVGIGVDGIISGSGGAVVRIGLIAGATVDDTGGAIGVAVSPDGSLVTTDEDEGKKVVSGIKDGVVVDPEVGVGAMVVCGWIDGAALPCGVIVGVTVYDDLPFPFPLPFLFFFDFVIFSFFDSTLSSFFDVLSSLVFIPLPLCDEIEGVVGTTARSDKPLPFLSEDDIGKINGT